MHPREWVDVWVENDNLNFQDILDRGMDRHINLLYWTVMRLWMQGLWPWSQSRWKK